MIYAHTYDSTHLQFVFCVILPFTTTPVQLVHPESVYGPFL